MKQHESLLHELVPLMNRLCLIGCFFFVFFLFSVYCIHPCIDLFVATATNLSIYPNNTATTLHPKCVHAPPIDLPIKKSVF
jgi:Sec-independent protein secretion pathway component TatC